MNQQKSDQLYVYIDGEYYKEQEAKISVFDHGLHYGDAVFDTCCSWNGKIFKLDEHITRLYRSAHSLRISIPLTKEEFKDAIMETVRRSNLQAAFIKPMVTRGVGPEPLLDPRNCKTTVIIIVRPYLYIAKPEKIDKGIRCKIVSVRRTPDECIPTKVKCCNYINLILMRMEAYDSGVDDAIAMTTQGFIAEAPGYNLFVVDGGKISTPSVAVLMGITRETVMEIANELGIPVEENNHLTPHDIYVADEVFLSSTAGGVVPVVEVDSRIVGNGKPGAITRKVSQAYRQMLESGVHGTDVY